MQALNRRAAALGFLTLSLSCVCAYGGNDVFAITINNDSSDNLLVTVYDQNTSPPQRVLSTTPLYGGASLSVSISPDGAGKGHLSWTAMTMDPDMRSCGHNDKSNLNDGDTVNVHADGDC